MENNESLANVLADPKPELNSEQSRLWEENHKAIMECIHKHMQSNFSIPTLAFITEKTGLSRPTVRKHIRGFSNQPDFKEHTAMFKFMSTNILRQLYSQSMYGEVKAARLYMELMGVLKHNALVENNFIVSQPEPVKLNDIEITEELLNNLNPEFREKLELVLKEGMKDRNQLNEGSILTPDPSL